MPLLHQGGRQADPERGGGVRRGALGQPVAIGALSILFAATAPEVVGDDYYGPRWLGGLRGRPARARRSRESTSDEKARMLVSVVSDLTGIPAPS